MDTEDTGSEIKAFLAQEYGLDFPSIKDLDYKQREMEEQLPAAPPPSAASSCDNTPLSGTLSHVSEIALKSNLYPSTYRTSRAISSKKGAVSRQVSDDSLDARMSASTSGLNSSANSSGWDSESGQNESSSYFMPSDSSSDSTTGISSGSLNNQHYLGLLPGNVDQLFGNGYHPNAEANVQQAFAKASQEARDGVIIPSQAMNSNVFNPNDEFAKKYEPQGLLRNMPYKHMSWSNLLQLPRDSRHEDLLYDPRQEIADIMYQRSPPASGLAAKREAAVKAKAQARAFRKFR